MIAREYSGISEPVRLNGVKRLAPADRDQLPVAAHIGLIKPRMRQAIDRVAGFIRRPFLVHIFVDAGQRAQHRTAAAIEPDVRANRVHHVDARRFFQLPRPRLESIRFRCQRANGAQIDDVARQFAGHCAFQIAGDLHILTAPNSADFLNASHFLGKADAAGALDAAGHCGLDQRPHIFLGYGALILVIPARAATIEHRLVLQVAFAALIANRAIERVVDEQKFHHPFTRLFDHRAVGADDLTLGGGQRAAGLRLGRPGGNLDQTHTAIARDAEAFMIAKTRNFFSGKFARLQDGSACGDFDFGAIYGDFRH